MPRPVALELDAVLANTRPLWREWLDDAARRFRPIAPLEPERLPADRGAAALELDGWAAAGVGDWRAALERFAEDRAPLFFRPDAEANAAVRRLAAGGAQLGVFTDAPEPLARVALAQLGVVRQLAALETGTGAEQRLLDRLGSDTQVVRTRDELVGLHV